MGHYLSRPLSGHLIGQRLCHHLGTLGWGSLCHLEKGKLPLHEGKHPPSVEVGDDNGRGQPLVRQALERIGVHL